MQLQNIPGQPGRIDKERIDYAIISTFPDAQQALQPDQPRGADVLAVPVALALCRRYLESFSYRMDLSPWIFIGTVLLSLLITFVSVILQIRRAAGVNPADTLKKE